MKRIIFLAIAATVLFAGCRSSKPVSPKFYLIEYAASGQEPEESNPLPYSLEIMEIDVHPAYSSTQIALREGQNELNYFVNHQWAARPAQSLERFMVKYFRLENIFQHASSRLWTDIPDYRLHTHVYNLELTRERRDFFARLHLEFTLEDTEGLVIASHRVDASRLLEERNIDLFSQAISNIFYEELKFFAEKISFEIKPQ